LQFPLTHNLAFIKYYSICKQWKIYQLLSFDEFNIFAAVNPPYKILNTPSIKVTIFNF